MRLFDFFSKKRPKKEMPQRNSQSVSQQIGNLTIQKVVYMSSADIFYKEYTLDNNVLVENIRDIIAFFETETIVMKRCFCQSFDEDGCNLYREYTSIENLNDLFNFPSPYISFSIEFVSKKTQSYRFSLLMHTNTPTIIYKIDKEKRLKVSYFKRITSSDSEKALSSDQKTASREVHKSPAASIPQNSVLLKEVANIKGFWYWIEDITILETVFSFLQPMVDALENQGYQITEVSASGGVHELDTGYECFSGMTYGSFDKAKECLPLDFSQQEAMLDGVYFNTLNFEHLSMKFTKDSQIFFAVFSRGALSVSQEIAELIPVSDMYTAIGKS